MQKPPPITSPYAPDLAQVRAWLDTMIRALRFVELVTAIVAFVARDMWIAQYSDATAHQPGRMHAVLLNMGDGCGATNEMDTTWGTGRLKMRMFNATGMDAPWGHLTSSVTLTPAAKSATWAVNPDGSGVNQALSSDVDALSATLYCYYGNHDYGAFSAMAFGLCDVDTSGCTYASDLDGEKWIVRIDPAAHRYEVRATLNGIPAGETVPCWMNVVYEDSDRDDGDGPPADIDPFPVPGSVAASCSNGC